MNAQIQAKIAKAQQKIQGLWGEVLLLGPLLPIPPAPINAIMGQEMLTQRFVEGKGIEEVTTLAVSVIVGDLSQAPFIGQPAQVRNRSWRVWNVRPTQTTWEITLESPTK